MNMNKEYRRELKGIARMRGKVQRDLADHIKCINKSITKLERERQKAKERVEREFRAFDKRQAILEGRLCPF